MYDRPLRWLVYALCLAGVVSCGQKGPLVLPEDEVTVPATQDTKKNAAAATEPGARQPLS